MTSQEPVAFVFPGQGSQALNMLPKLRQATSHVIDTWQEASDVLGFDVNQLVTEGPIEILNQTENTQPVLLATSYAAWRYYQAQGQPAPSLLAGHSLGEYSALVCAEVLTFAEALRLVKLRGQLMQQSVPEGVGAMAAIIGLEAEVIGEICQDIDGKDGRVSVANYNSPLQTVIAGHKAAVQAAMAALKEAGAKRALELPVSVPSHSPLMQQASETFAEALSKISYSPAKIPVIHNVDVKIHTDPVEVQKALAAQLVSPVRWVETLTYFDSQEIIEIIECGPGKVLTGLGKRTLPDCEHLSIE